MSLIQSGQIFRYFLPSGETVSRSESELGRFTDSLIEAEHQYLCDTGRSPDKLILGKKEFVEYCGMMAIQVSRGLLRRFDQDGPPRMQWRGLDIVKSSMDSLLIAAETAARE